jgi:hypothetical protein
VAYSVRDILWLRLFALTSALVALPYFALQPTPLWVPLGWTAVFATINGLQSWRLFMERRPVQLTTEEQAARRLLFRDLPPRKVLQVLSIGSWTTVEKGERLIEHGRGVEAISLILRGKVLVTKDKNVLGELGAGSLVGSALLLSGVTANVEAVAIETLRTIRWEVETLLKFLDANPEARIIMQGHLARDLAGKLASCAERRAA